MTRFNAVQTLRTVADLLDSNGYAEAKQIALSYINHKATGWKPVLHLIKLMEKLR